MLNDSLPAIQQQLRDGIAKGYWTLQDLDIPSRGWDHCTRVDRRMFPSGYVGIPHRNLLRDGEPQERVEARPSDHDFTPAIDHDPFPDFDV